MNRWQKIVSRLGFVCKIVLPWGISGLFVASFPFLVMCFLAFAFKWLFFGDYWAFCFWLGFLCFFGVPETIYVRLDNPTIKTGR
jgi:hypothetical protein